MKSFASDNYAGIHPIILRSIIDANQKHAPAYGGDPYTQEAALLFKKHFGTESQTFFVCNGTSANVLGLSTLLKPYQAILCAESAHIHTDECGSAEHYLGSKLLTIPTKNGKLTVDSLIPFLPNPCNPHQVQPKVISISQTTEWATVYTAQEI